MKNGIPYMRVGTTMYKQVNQPAVNGGFTKRLIPWTSSAIKADHGNDYLSHVPKYDEFCTVPNHSDYQPTIGCFLNLYQPIDHVPKEGEFPHIEALVRHIFGEQYELGVE